MLNQWESFLKNLNVWVGSFTQFSPQGKQVDDRASRLTLEGLNDNQSARLTLQREGLQDLVLEFSTIARSTLFFENGAFSQGTIQFAPFAEFGAEFGLIHENRRMRLVQLFNNDGNLKSLTLIREHSEGSEKAERPQLSLEALLGEWEGETTTIFTDLRNPVTSTTKMKLHLEDGRLVQNLSFGNHIITSTAKIKGSILEFDGNPNNPIHILMLPDGASATFPTKLQSRQPLFLETGWLIEPNWRQRMIRSYDDKGEWTSLTLASERKIGNG
ncbi:hypothetical protein DSM106972_076530 [Dulcicalothrix desertica PCC 7102]|uniref:DUF3598 domain-containing protein n=1 Tax=Dulcicalothrix desertica PCC 7102 TaxID=232991 RepID=A0A3S1CBE9_9CYAN|nr:DUF3598 family protein [Dulcicalothrix desertica]RUT00205.1 hypothetical protein DSM106972_076530 [Dulcicalothrix desertica PCC 7102]TWH55673.1 uncharacterized protein DUF3598 [Dulcicalothrix desertica PCC 7102]